ncbi:hypothetical protein An01g05380 [Aspergillus niger]|uniref:Uncharacterized protein n=2 Tax=Aspergillus niger TaxID=5061 RepID=A2Q8S4_ASPNC|nr:hypothetical protein An01g05380 [Aspergillus niger]CAK43707.1 hypothetical protein An01g05380 [Aspergillus niger]
MASLRSHGATHTDTHILFGRTVGGLDQALFMIDDVHLQILIENASEPRQEEGAGRQPEHAEGSFGVGPNAGAMREGRAKAGFLPVWVIRPASIATLSLLWANSPWAALEHRPIARLGLGLMNPRGLISPANQPSRSRRSARTSVVRRHWRTWFDHAGTASTTNFSVAEVFRSISKTLSIIDG